MQPENNKSLTLKFLLHLHPSRILERSSKFTYTFGLGGLALFSFIVTALTGILLMFTYSPAQETAYQSLLHIATVMPFGWYIRNLHYWSAQVMVIAAILHMMRIVFTGGYLNCRAFNWLIGIVLLVLTLMMDFTGYVLRWDSVSGFALTAGTNLIRETPVIGEGIYRIITGGTEISGSTLLRFYAWHVAGLPFIAFAFMIYHFFRIRKDGGISTAELAGQKRFMSGDYLLKKEIFFALIISTILVLLSVAFTPDISQQFGSENAPETVKAPWIFLGVQFLLRYIHPLIAGIIIPFLVLIMWGIIPYIDKNNQSIGIWFARDRKNYWIPFIVSVLIIAGLMIAEMIL